MRIGIGSDHAGYELKEYLKEVLKGKGYELRDYGTFKPERCDYPDIALQVISGMLSGELDKAILICGTGQGMAMVANKFSGIRASLCWDVTSARLARQHNDANVLTLGGRLIGKELALDIALTWLNTEFEGGRHARRVDKFSNFGSDSI